MDKAMRHSGAGPVVGARSSLVEVPISDESAPLLKGYSEPMPPRRRDHAGASAMKPSISPTSCALR